jgi:hypothetical protein
MLVFSMDNERRKNEMVKRLGRMEELLSAGDRKKLRQAEKERLEAKEKEEAIKKKTTYEVGTTSYEINQRLKRMEELETQGRIQQSKQNKKDLWAKLSDQARRKSA